MPVSPSAREGGSSQRELRWRMAVTAAAVATAIVLSVTPAEAQTCFTYSDTVQAPVPIRCVQKNDLSTACSWPTDCTTVTAAGPQTILDMHTRWHQCFGNVGGATPPAGRSNRWYAFHRQFEHDFNIWRRGIGFAPIESLDWCPGMNLPVGTGPQLQPGDHVSGCGTGAPRPDNVPCPGCSAFPQCLFHPGAGPLGCPGAPDPDCETPGGAVSFPHTSLDQFANIDDVAKILDAQFHGSMHSAVANADCPGCYNSDSNTSNCSPRDPMFWRLHKALDDVVRAWQDAKAVDVVVVIDRSGSMSDLDSTGVSKFQAALNAVDNFADLLEDTRTDGQVNRIGVVSYSNSAAINLNLTDADANLRAAGGPLATALSGLSAGGPGGCTGIGAGIQKAVEMLCPPGDCQGFAAAGDNDRKAILVLTDGLENQPPCLQPAGAAGGGCGIQCFGPQLDYDKLQFTQAVAVGFGNSSSLNGDLLTLLAERQGGIYMQNPVGPGDDLKHFFTKAFGRLTDEFLLIDPEGTLAANEAASEPVEYTSCGDQKLTFASGWQTPAAAAELRLLVTSPTGELITRGSPGIESSREPTWEFARIPLPYRGANEGTWRAQLVRPHRSFVNGFTPDSFVDPDAGVALVRRQIQRLCPDGCKRVLSFEAKRLGPVSVYERAVQEEEAAGLLGSVKSINDPADLAQALGSDRWDLIVYARMGAESAEPYDQILQGLLCRGQRAILTDTRRQGQGILRCAGALRDDNVNFPSFQGDGRLVTGPLELKNPGHPVMSYGLRPTLAESQPQAFAAAGKIAAILARINPGKEHRWYLDVLGRGLSKLEVHNRSLDQRAGDELVATARILPSYVPAGGFDRVDARVEVEFPRVGLGSLLAQQRDRRERRVGGEMLDPRANALSQIVVPTATASFPLVDDGTQGDLHAANAYWSGTLHGLGAVDGMYKLRYVFDFTRNGCTTRREAVQSVYVDLRVDPKASRPEVVERTPAADGGWRLLVRLRPADRFGNLLGPGRLELAGCQPEKSCRVDPSTVQDHGDGSYTVALRTAPGTPGVRLAAAGTSFDVPLPCADCPRLGRIRLDNLKTNEHSFTKGTVRLAAPAPRGGAVVHLASSNSGAAVVPVSVTIPEGQQEATFEIAVHHAHNGPSPATISASYGADRSDATLTVIPLKKGRGNTTEPPATPVKAHDHSGHD